MEISITFNTVRLKKLFNRIGRLKEARLVLLPAVILSLLSIFYSLHSDIIIAYGDAESHLNISKRVIDSLTPGLAQLGGVWLPLPHLLMIPLVYFNFLWTTGLAGSIVSGLSFVIASLFIYKTTFLLTRSRPAGFLSFLLFALNPNILYMQSTPLTELPLLMFFVLSTYFFLRFLYDDTKVMYLLPAAFFGFCATLTRYDGWFLVLFEALIIIIYYAVYKHNRTRLEGRLILFSTLAFYGMGLWILWDFLILGDPFYFTNSQFSAKSQQMAWLTKGELPAYHNLLQSFLYYFVTSMSITGVVIFAFSVIGFILLLRDKTVRNRLLIATLLAVPFIFYVVTLFLGQSIIFIPHLTPVGFEWRLFNVRYGLMMIPLTSIAFAYFFHKRPLSMKTLLVFLILFQFVLYGAGFSKVETLADGTAGLSRAKRPDAERWLNRHYDGGLVMIDDYSRVISIIRSGIPMNNIIYLGNKPYWEESLSQPQKYASWVIIQKDDDIWKKLYQNSEAQGRLYKYFKKVYTSPDILIFEKSNQA